MKQKTKDIVALVILIIQVAFGSFLIILGAFGSNSKSYIGIFIITLGVFLLIGSGRKEVWDLFNLFKKTSP